MKKHPKHIFFGKWIHLKTEYRNESGEWRLHKYYYGARYVWRFRDSAFFDHGGALERGFRGTKSSVKRFNYNASDAKLCIDEFFYTADGRMVACFEDHFRVAIKGASTLTLSVIDHPKQDPEEDHFRIVLRRFTIRLLLAETVKDFRRRFTRRGIIFSGKTAEAEPLRNPIVLGCGFRGTAGKAPSRTAAG